MGCRSSNVLIELVFLEEKLFFKIIWTNKITFQSFSQINLFFQILINVLYNTKEQATLFCFKKCDDEDEGDERGL